MQAIHHGVDTGIGLEAHAIVVGYTSRVGWEELVIRREAGSDSRRAVREMIVHVYANRDVTVVLVK